MGRRPPLRRGGRASVCPFDGEIIEGRNAIDEAIGDGRCDCRSGKGSGDQVIGGHHEPVGGFGDCAADKIRRRYAAWPRIVQMVGAGAKEAARPSPAAMG